MDGGREYVVTPLAPLDCTPTPLAYCHTILDMYQVTTHYAQCNLVIHWYWEWKYDCSISRSLSVSKTASTGLCTIIKIKITVLSSFFHCTGEKFKYGNTFGALTKGTVPELLV